PAPGDHRPVGGSRSLRTHRARQSRGPRVLGAAEGGGRLPLGPGRVRARPASRASPSPGWRRLGPRPRDRGRGPSRPGALPRDRPLERPPLRASSDGIEARADVEEGRAAQAQGGMVSPVTLSNTLGRRTTELSPIEPGHVRLYTCGPTVYYVIHIGNLRTFLFEDVLR